MYLGIGKYGKIGETSDGNKYPVLYGGDDNETRIKFLIGVPVDDYQAVNKHFDEISQKLEEIENLLDTKNGKTIGVVTHKGNNNGCESGCFVPPMSPLLQSFLENDVPQYDLGMLKYPSVHAPKARMPEDVDYKYTTTEPYVKISTWLHTIAYGVHKETMFIQDVHVGYKPFCILEPSQRDIIELSPAEIDEYVQDVLKWQTREKEIKSYYENKDRIVGITRDSLQAEIKCVVDTGKMLIIDQSLPSCAEDYIQHIKLNPFAVWISEDRDVPEKFKYLLLDED